jgi:hypothetical protein
MEPRAALMVLDALHDYPKISVHATVDLNELVSQIEKEEHSAERIVVDNDDLPKIKKYIPLTFPKDFRGQDQNFNIVFSLVIEKNGVINPFSVKVKNATHDEVIDWTVAKVKNLVFEEPKRDGKPVRLLVDFGYEDWFQRKQCISIAE